MEKMDFKYFLEKLEEIGYVEELLSSIAYVSGLPNAKLNEIVIFEDNTRGQIIGLDTEKVEVLLFSHPEFTVGSKVARTGGYLQIEVGSKTLGSVLDPLGQTVGTLLASQPSGVSKTIARDVDVPPIDIMKRKEITKPLETGVLMVDLIVPVAKGQRELIVGDRNTGKTSLLKQIAINQATQKTICIFALIGKKKVALERLIGDLKRSASAVNMVVVAADAAMPSGVNYLTPYTAMSVAEYFRDLGHDVLVIFDDLTAHAKYYREISLLARRFPGRNSYPGDIFYVHSRLLERAGSFAKGTITALPVAETIMADLSGYIQTNLMAMTDGHIFFDKNIFDAGKLPAINQFLSVTRVGLQARTPLLRDVSRILSNFLVQLDRIRQYMHFGSELGEETKKLLSLGERADEFFKQDPTLSIPVNIGVFLLGVLWGGFWVNDTPHKMKTDMTKMINLYKTNQKYKVEIDKIVSSVRTLRKLVDQIRLNDQLVHREVDNK